MSSINNTTTNTTDNTNNTTINTSPCNSMTNKKTVTFGEVVRVKKTLHINNFTKEEIDSCWFSRADMLNIRQELCLDIRQLEYNLHHNIATPDTEDSTPRGLECRTRQGSQQRREQRYESACAVIDEQELQRHERSINSESNSDSNSNDNSNSLLVGIDMIAAIYADTTRDAQVRANVQGMLDQQVVYYRNGKEQTSSSESSTQRTVLKSSQGNSVVVVTGGIAA